jgi:putative DNA primase/helicase
MADIVDIRDKVAARVQEEAEHIPPEDKKTGTGGPEDPKFVRACLGGNERGDGILYASMHRGTFLYNKIQGRWFRWDDHFWSPDLMNTSVEGVEKVALKYQTATDPISEDIAELTTKINLAKVEIDRCEANDDKAGVASARADVDIHTERKKKLTAERKKLYDRANQLRGKTRAEKCLWWAHCVPGALAVKGDEFDRKPMLLPAPNGVIDLETGSLHKGNPDDLLIRFIPISYDPDAKAPDWMPFLMAIYEDDEEKVNFVRRYLGYCLTGLNIEQIILAFLGDGANGKGTLFELMHYLMGSLAWSINPELILEQKNPRPTAGPTADIVSLYGRRLVIASETDKNRRIGSANLKRFTGGDTLIGRSPHDKEETNFEPTHKMALITNDAPLGLLADFSLQRRIRLINHRLRYVQDVEAEQKRDPQNAEFFRKSNKELPKMLRQQATGILADLVRACLEYQQVGLIPPQSIVDAAESHRRSEDHLSRFVTEACSRVDDDPDYRIRIGVFHESYMKWYSSEVSAKDRYQPSKIAVGKELVKMGYRKENQSGQTWIYGISLPPDSSSMPYE